MRDQHDQFLDTREAAEFLEEIGVPVAEKTLENHRWRGTGPPFYRIARKVRYKPADLVRWIEGHRFNAEAAAVGSR